MARPAIAQQPAEISADQIVQRLVASNQDRAERLKQYTSMRRYTLVYHGFPSGREATMLAEVTYHAPTAKSFKVVSEAGSKLLIERVLRKLLESEKEAALDPARTALTPANYTFALDGKESGAYVLRVEPRVESKFLYRGRIWVDPSDFAVTRIEAEPAKNPSFWIKKTQIRHRYFKVGDFWLPQQNETETRTRLGGTANLTIFYFDYQVSSARAR